ncbi:MAG TPA: fluoride efflux transporter CrcB [Steroidobacteraceae bacterium]|nr:fluoride efflux transporter CrcB [Steroidobacteraceae bacterium]
MNGFLLVFLGGGFGSAARHGVNLLSAQFVGVRYPVGTFAINVVGSLVIGLLAEWFALRTQLPAPLRLFLITGVIGGFTTFSTFALEIGLLYERGQLGAAAIYAIGSVVCAVGALFAGMSVVRYFST